MPNTVSDVRRFRRASCLQLMHVSGHFVRCVVVCVSPFAHLSWRRWDRETECREKSQSKERHVCLIGKRLRAKQWTGWVGGRGGRWGGRPVRINGTKELATVFFSAEEASPLERRHFSASELHSIEHQIDLNPKIYRMTGRSQRFKRQGRNTFAFIGTNLAEERSQQKKVVEIAEW